MLRIYQGDGYQHTTGIIESEQEKVIAQEALLFTRQGHCIKSNGIRAYYPTPDIGDYVSWFADVRKRVSV